MTELRILVEFEYLEKGLIPPEMDVDEALSFLTDDESRIAKRKFRKVFRKLIKSKNIHRYSKAHLQARFGYPGIPTDKQKRNRKEWVHEIITRKITRHSGKSSSSRLLHGSDQID